MISHKFPRHNRIRKRRDFLLCYNKGKKYYCAHFLLYALNAQGMCQRAGIAVSRKVGNAVIRNRVKRLLREFFRRQGFEYAGLQLVAVARPSAAGLCYAEVEAELLPVLRHASHDATLQGAYP